VRRPDAALDLSFARLHDSKKIQSGVEPPHSKSGCQKPEAHPRPVLPLGFAADS
jgi:hypothetical protein